MTHIQVSDGSVFNNLGTFMAERHRVLQRDRAPATSSFNNMGTFTTLGNRAEFSGAVQHARRVASTYR